MLKTLILTAAVAGSLFAASLAPALAASANDRSPSGASHGVSTAYIGGFSVAGPSVYANRSDCQQLRELSGGDTRNECYYANQLARCH